MDLKGQISVVTVVLLTGLLSQTAPAHSSQKIAGMSRYGEMMSAELGSLSPSELSLMELQREREDLLRNRSKDNPRIFKNKLTILDNKITYLQDQIKRANPNVVRTRLIPLQDKRPVRPVAVALKESAPREASLSRASLVWTPNVTRPKTSSAAASRQSFSRSALSPKTAPALEAASRAALQEKELPPAPPPKSKAAKTGVDWKQMSRADKEIYILSVMGSLSRRDVYLMKPYSYYIGSIDRAVGQNAALEKESIHRILMMTAYDSEPDTRKDLEKIWK